MLTREAATTEVLNTARPPALWAEGMQNVYLDQGMRQTELCLGGEGAEKKLEAGSECLWFWVGILEHGLLSEGGAPTPCKLQPKPGEGRDSDLILDVIVLEEEIDKSISSLCFHHSLRLDMITHHFTGEDTEAQRGEVTCPRPHSYLVARGALESA